jgi:hypothetical protein
MVREGPAIASLPTFSTVFTGINVADTFASMEPLSLPEVVRVPEAPVTPPLQVGGFEVRSSVSRFPLTTMTLNSPSGVGKVADPDLPSNTTETVDDPCSKTSWPLGPVDEPEHGTTKLLNV